MAYNIYQDSELIAENVEEKSYTVTGLQPNTQYTFEVAEVIGNQVSSKNAVTVTTDRVEVTEITLSPKTMRADAGVAGSRSLSHTITPASASDNEVEYILATPAAGLTVTSDGALKWDETVPAGEYTVKVKEVYGNKEASSVLTLSEPEVAPV